MASAKVDVSVAMLREIITLFKVAGIFIDGSAECPMPNCVRLKISGIIVPQAELVDCAIKHEVTEQNFYGIKVEFSILQK